MQAQNDPDTPDVDDAEDEATNAKLAELRKAITAAKTNIRTMHQEMSQLDQLMTTCSSHLEQLKAVPEVLASKENLMEDIKVIAEKGKQLEAGYLKLEQLRKERAHHSNGTTPAEDMTDEGAEKEILRRQAAMKSAPLQDMQRLQERIGGGTS